MGAARRAMAHLFVPAPRTNRCGAGGLMHAPLYKYINEGRSNYKNSSLKAKIINMLSMEFKARSTALPRKHVMLLTASTPPATSIAEDGR